VIALAEKRRTEPMDDEEIIKEMWFGFNFSTSGENKLTKEVQHGMEQAAIRLYRAAHRQGMKDARLISPTPAGVEDRMAESDGYKQGVDDAKYTPTSDEVGDVVEPAGSTSRQTADAVCRARASALDTITEGTLLAYPLVQDIIKRTRLDEKQKFLEEIVIKEAEIRASSRIDALREVQHMIEKEAKDVVWLSDGCTVWDGIDHLIGKDGGTQEWEAEIRASERVVFSEKAAAKTEKGEEWTTWYIKTKQLLADNIDHAEENKDDLGAKYWKGNLDTLNACNNKLGDIAQEAYKKGQVELIASFLEMHNNLADERKKCRFIHEPQDCYYCLWAKKASESLGAVDGAGEPKPQQEASPKPENAKINASGGRELKPSGIYPKRKPEKPKKAKRRNGYAKRL
jgi:hypothetical protein